MARLLLPLLLLLQGTASAEQPRTSIVLIALDPLRADRLAACGGKGSAMPRVEAFARGAAAYVNAFTPAPWTLPAAMSAFTSLYPSDHGVKNSRRVDAGGELQHSVLSTSAVTVAEVLAARGYATAAFTGGYPFSARHGYHRGFETFVDTEPFRGAGVSFSEGLAWLRALPPGRPFFLFLHAYDPHSRHFLRSRLGTDPEKAPKSDPFRKLWDKFAAADKGLDAPEFTAREKALLRDTYDERLAGADEAFGRLMTELAADGRLDGTAVILYSHHGEGLFDHGYPGHGRNLYDELLRVPLLVRAPGLAPGPRKERVSLLDLAPTLAQLSGGPDPRLAAQAAGAPLPPFPGAPQGCRDLFHETDFMLRAFSRAARDCSGWKLIRDETAGTAELYDLDADPGERKDLFSSEPGKAAELEEKLSAWRLE